MIKLMSATEEDKTDENKDKESDDYNFVLEVLRNFLASEDVQIRNQEKVDEILDSFNLYDYYKSMREESPISGIEETLVENRELKPLEDFTQSDYSAFYDGLFVDFERYISRIERELSNFTSQEQRDLGNIPEQILNIQTDNSFIDDFI